MSRPSRLPRGPNVRPIRPHASSTVSTDRSGAAGLPLSGRAGCTTFVLGGKAEACEGGRGVSMHSCAVLGLGMW